MVVVAEADTVVEDLAAAVLEEAVTVVVDLVGAVSVAAA